MPDSADDFCATFHTAVHNEEQLAALEEASLDEPVTVWMNSIPVCTVWA